MTSTFFGIHLLVFPILAIVILATIATVRRGRRDRRYDANPAGYLWVGSDSGSSSCDSGGGSC